ncbi:cytochrome o ubiquinol oxidase subunit III [Bartonella sp. TP]|uniref:cytochrome o ubiquinol oxidase subunit III n=1 Tax=Bartonella sp. TP TaxID=3057550 RepID=UPI0025B1A74B|nr:cytochrome o ubiquinol oxidase subunit III [Bartonella sp. TP]MDN5248600.1 cytochrome o ubiquinol oxidase subunit III [Alphaproteobacteria bacterium]MDN5249223.1 cytochrome o ubiquinol oxidase subunit III [Alphaproteobacteria bacterium]WJW80413.1 cytochrome o ubiquinol oxidase subunit III [Bartonella sp. TP]
MSSLVEKEEHHHEHDDSIMLFGFWVYILSDLILFATLFANFAVFASAYYGGPHGNSIIEGEKLFDLKFVMAETFLLLFSSITYGFAMVSAKQEMLNKVKLWLGITFVLGASFIAMELYEFHHLYKILHDPILNQSHLISAYFSAFFMLVGTHGLHVTTGLIWIALMFFQLGHVGLNHHNKTRLACLSIFWHFLDIIWIGVFTAVYLLGVL